jgi:hypothetical protein
MSKVNKSMTKEQVIDLFASAIKEKDLDTKPKTMRYNIARGYETLSGDGLSVVNILREFA